MPSEQIIKYSESPGSITHVEGKLILVFALDEPRYALPLSAVERVVRAVEITPLPNAPAIIQGAINVQGAIIPVVNIRESFSLAGARDELRRPFHHRAHAATEPLCWWPITWPVFANVPGARLMSAGETLPFVEYLREWPRRKTISFSFTISTLFLSLDEERALDTALADGAE